eukprot:3931986-Rhodomonas_salina.1
MHAQQAAAFQNFHGFASQNAQAPMRYDCNFQCGFAASFHEVAAHETVCPYNPRNSRAPVYSFAGYPTPLPYRSARLVRKKSTTSPARLTPKIPKPADGRSAYDGRAR